MTRWCDSCPLLIISPTGTGTRPGFTDEAVIQFIRAQAPGAKYVLSVCTGSELLARAGILEGKRATTNKSSFNRIRVCFLAVCRRAHGLHPTAIASDRQLGAQGKMGRRWEALDLVRRGCRYEASSTVSSAFIYWRCQGADMGYAFMEHLVGHEVSTTIRAIVELSIHKQDDDEFAEHYKLA